MTDVVSALPERGCRAGGPADPATGRLPGDHRRQRVHRQFGDVARRYGAQVVTVPQPGYGAAVHAGIVTCDPADGVVGVMDADGSLDLAELPRAAGTRSKVTGTIRGTARAVRDMSAVLAR